MAAAKSFKMEQHHFM